MAKDKQNKQKEELLKQTGVVKEAFSMQEYIVQLDNGILVRAKISGKIRMNHIRILVGDRVELEVSPYDLKRGRITYRYQ